MLTAAQKYKNSVKYLEVRQNLTGSSGSKQVVQAVFPIYIEGNGRYALLQLELDKNESIS